MTGIVFYTAVMWMHGMHTHARRQTQTHAHWHTQNSHAHKCTQAHTHTHTHIPTHTHTYPHKNIHILPIGFPSLISTDESVCLNPGIRQINLEKHRHAAGDIVPGVKLRWILC